MRSTKIILLKSILLTLLLSAGLCSFAQPNVYNGNFESWHGGYFNPGAGVDTPNVPHGDLCCGAALATPDLWGTPEHLMAMALNHFVFREIDSTIVHSGNISARLLTDITDIDSAGDPTGTVAILVPGRVTCSGILGYGGLARTGDPYKTIAHSLGAPFADTPYALNFYIRFNHDVADTAMYAYAFTHWDSIAHRRDTLAVNVVDIPDATIPNNQWTKISDTIHYQLNGMMPDTLHMIFYGGRTGDSTRAGNLTWIDDVSFYYPNDSTSTGIREAHTSNVAVYPNPTSSALHIRLGATLNNRYSIAMYDLTGRKVIEEPVFNEAIISTAPLPDGVYLYRILDQSAAAISSGKVTIQQ